jgi:hypothetical protein
MNLSPSNQFIPSPRPALANRASFQQPVLGLAGGQAGPAFAPSAFSHARIDRPAGVT